jgi:hypothetical protein
MEINHLVELGVDGKVVLKKELIDIGYGGMK